MKYRGLLSFGLWMAMVSAGWSQWLDFDLRRDIPWRIGEVKSSKTPTKIVAVWTDAVLHQAGKPATRGFGGRLMFYGPDESTPIKVDGTLVVYAFDEEGRSPTDVKPDRKYVFPPNQFARHYSKSKLGHSYSVWIPWDEVGGPRKEISLIARFIPKNGGAAIVSAQSRQHLPGLPTAEAPTDSSVPPSASPSVRQTVRTNPGRTSSAAWTPPAGRTSSERSSAPYEGPPGQYQPAHLLPVDAGPSFPADSRQTSFDQDESPPPSPNPLRPTSYEQSTPPGGNSPVEDLQNQPRMKTTTIPVPAPWLRPAGPAGPSSSPLPYRGSDNRDVPYRGSDNPDVPYRGSDNPDVPYRGSDNRDGQQWAAETGDSSPVQRTYFPTSVPNAAGRNQTAYPTPPAVQRTDVTGFASPRNETFRSWPSQRPSTRSGPLGPQVPTGSIAPQARDRAALPPLP